MQLWKKLYNYTLTGKTRVPSGNTLDIESGGLFKLAGTQVTADAGELNILDGVLATAAEINKACDVSTRIVNTTATTLAVTAASHGGRVVTVSSAAPIAITLPAATGSGEMYTFVIAVAATATAHTIKVAAASTDIVQGVSIIAQTDTAQVGGFLATATDDTITLNGTTKAGKAGDKITLIDVSANTWQVTILGGASGTVVTPFSATV
jgi:hypothetical protein